MPLTHKLTGFENRVEKCSQRGTDCVFKLSSLRFVNKGLNGYTPPSYRTLFSLAI